MKYSSFLISITKYIILLLVFTSCNICRILCPDNDSEFNGFKILKIPRSDVFIGSNWIQGIGPIEYDSVPCIETHSIEKLFVNGKNDFFGKLKLSLTQKLGFDILYQEDVSKILKIDKAYLVRVKDLGSMPFSQDSYIIWEGIKLKEFTVFTKKENKFQITNNIRNLSKDTDTIKFKFFKDDSLMIKVEGFNLFIAFRIIGFDKPVNTYDTIEIENKSNFDLQDGYYSVRFKKITGNEKFEKLERNNDICSVVMEISSYMERDSNFLPKVRYWKLDCLKAPSEGKYTITSRIVQQGIIVDEFHIDSISIKHTKKNIKVSGKFHLRTNFIKIKSLQKPNAAGW